MWFLAAVENHSVLIQLAGKLTPLVFPPAEFCPTGFMYIIQRGSALWAARMLRDGMTWGDDVILEDEQLQLDFPALAATYLLVFAIDGGTILHTIRAFPTVYHELRKVCVRWRLKRALVREAERRAWQRGQRFRNRLRPLYAKEIAHEMNEREEEWEKLTQDQGTSKHGLHARRQALIVPSSSRKSAQEGRCTRASGRALPCKSAMRGAAKSCAGSVRASAAAPTAKAGARAKPIWRDASGAKMKLGAAKSDDRKGSVIVAAKHIGLEAMQQQMKQQMRMPSAEGGLASSGDSPLTMRAQGQGSFKGSSTERAIGGAHAIALADGGGLLDSMRAEMQAQIEGLEKRLDVKLEGHMERVGGLLQQSLQQALASHIPGASVDSSAPSPASSKRHASNFALFSA